MTKRVSLLKYGMAAYDDQLNSLSKNIQTLTFVIIFLIIAVFILFIKNFGGESGKDAVEPVKKEAEITQPEAPKVTLDKIKKLFVKGNIYFGDKNSPNLLVMVSDPSCPYCQIAAGKNPELNRQVGGQFLPEEDGGSYLAPLTKMREMVEEGKAAFVWLYQNGHNSGEMATKALYCAYEQNRFWEAHDLIMSSEGYTLINEEVQNNPDNAGSLVNFLSSAVDAEKLQKCLKSGKYDERLNKDMKIAASLGVNGTPNFFINTVNFSGAYSWEQMQSSIK